QARAQTDVHHIRVFIICSLLVAGTVKRPGAAVREARTDLPGAKHAQAQVWERRFSALHRFRAAVAAAEVTTEIVEVCDGTEEGKLLRQGTKAPWRCVTHGAVAIQRILGVPAQA